MKLSQFKQIIREQVRRILKENAIYDGKATLQPGTKFQMTGYTTTVIKDLGDKLLVKVDLPQYDNKKPAEIKKDMFKGMKHIKTFDELQESFNMSDYTKDLSDIIKRHKQDFFNKVQTDLAEILGNSITKKLKYDNELYYEINVGREKYFTIRFGQSEYDDTYVGVISFSETDSHEFEKKSSLVSIFKMKKILP
jgi:hypothetical protein